MSLLIVSFLSGILTVLAPCVLPLLPVIIGGSLTTKNFWRPILVTSGLLVSLVIFTILLKASTVLINIDPKFWTYISGGIVTIFGLIYLFPNLWDNISIKLNLSSKSDKLLNSASQKGGWVGQILMGAALGPVFASCSPTYALIIATILPVNFVEGFVYIIAYILGLALVMLAIALVGRSLIQRLKVFSNPNGWFKKFLGVLFLIVGISVITGFDKQVEIAILSSNFFDVTKIEQTLLEKNVPQ